MSWQVIPYTVTLFISVLISLLTVFFALRTRFPSRTRSAFIIFVSGVTIWTICYAFEIASVGLEQKLFWANLQYLGVLLVPPALLTFVLLYTHQEHWLTLTTWIGFGSLTLLFQILIWTDQYHHQLRSNLQYIFEPFPKLQFDFGPLFVSIIIYFHLILMFSTLALIRNLFQTTRYYRGQTLAILTALILPWSASIIEILQIDLIPHLSPVVFSFIISGLILVWAFWRFRLLDIIPIAQKAIIENIPDGIIVLDSLKRINNLNPAACRILAVQQSEVIGKAVLTLLPEAEKILKNKKPTEISLGAAPFAGYFELLITELFWQPKKSGGYLLILREITRRKRVEEALQASETQYRNVCERANDGIAILQDHVIKYINPQLQMMLGWPQDEVLEKPFTNFVWQEDIQFASDRYSRRIVGEKVPSRYEMGFVNKTKGKILVEINASLTEFEGKPADLIFVRDISEQIRIREELISKNQQLEDAIQEANKMRDTAEKHARELETLHQATQVVSIGLEQEETIWRILEQLAMVVFYDSATVQLQRGDFLEIVGSRGFDQHADILGMQHRIDENNPGAAVFLSQKPLIFEDVQAIYHNFLNDPHNRIHGWLGVPLTIKDRTIGLLTLDSHTKGYFTEDHARLASAFANQVAIALENTRLFTEVQRLAITDPLTNLLNRRHFYSLTLHEFMRFQRYSTPFSVIMLDIDHFKLVNDTYGHLAGDRVLQTLADIFRENMRSVDILCRFGGEEFIATLPETGAEKACSLAERLRETIHNTIFSTDSGDVHITVSIGVGEFTNGFETIDQLLDCVDKALYTSKIKGRNRVSLYNSEIIV